MADSEPVEQDPNAAPVQKQSNISRRKPLVSPTSSFVDFAELTTEIYTDEDKETSNLYDPFIHRKIKKPTTDFETCVHLLKGAIGAGVLSMPRAFDHAGVCIGVPGTIILGAICVYGIHIMLRMQQLLCQRLRVPFLTLPRSMRIAFLNGPNCFHKFAWLAAFLVDFFLVSNQIGLCATYIIFIATSIKRVVRFTFITGPNEDRAYMAVLFLPVLIISFIRNLKKLMPVSLLADIFTALAFGICFYYIFGSGDGNGLLKNNNVEYVADYKTWPLFLANVMFALEAVGVMIALEHNMGKPQHFLGYRGIFPWSMVAVVALYMAIGLFGYLKYAGKIDDKTNTIIMLLPPKDWPADCAQVLIALAIYGSYPLQLYVGLEIIWGNYIRHYIKNHDNEYIYEYILRTSVVVLTFILAIVNPHVDLMIELVGAFCLSSLGLIAPFLLELCTKWPDQLGPFKWVLVKDILLVVFGVFILITGTTTAIINIVATLS